MTRVTPLSPRTRGYRASENGLSESDCPYPVGTRARIEWRSGYWDAVQGRPLLRGAIPREVTVVGLRATRIDGDDMPGGCDG